MMRKTMGRGPQQLETLMRLWVLWHMMTTVMDMISMDVVWEPWADVVDLVACPWLLTSLYTNS